MADDFCATLAIALTQRHKMIEKQKPESMSPELIKITQELADDQISDQNEFRQRLDALELHQFRVDKHIYTIWFFMAYHEENMGEHNRVCTHKEEVAELATIYGYHHREAHPALDPAVCGTPLVLAGLNIFVVHPRKLAILHNLLLKLGIYLRTVNLAWQRFFKTPPTKDKVEKSRIVALRTSINNDKYIKYEAAIEDLMRCNADISEFAASVDIEDRSRWMASTSERYKDVVREADRLIESYNQNPNEDRHEIDTQGLIKLSPRPHQLDLIDLDSFPDSEPELPTSRQANHTYLSRENFSHEVTDSFTHSPSSLNLLHQNHSYVRNSGHKQAAITNTTYGSDTKVISSSISTVALRKTESLGNVHGLQNYAKVNTTPVATQKPSVHQASSNSQKRTYLPESTSGGDVVEAKRMRISTSACTEIPVQKRGDVHVIGIGKENAVVRTTNGAKNTVTVISQRNTSAERSLIAPTNYPGAEPPGYNSAPTNHQAHESINPGRSQQVTDLIVRPELNTSMLSSTRELVLSQADADHSADMADPFESKRWYGEGGLMHILRYKTADCKQDTMRKGSQLIIPATRKGQVKCMFGMGARHGGSARIWKENYLMKGEWDKDCKLRVIAYEPMEGLPGVVTIETSTYVCDIDPSREHAFLIAHRIGEVLVAGDLGEISANRWESETNTNGDSPGHYTIQKESGAMCWKEGGSSSCKLNIVWSRQGSRSQREVKFWDSSFANIVVTNEGLTLNTDKNRQDKNVHVLVTREGEVTISMKKKRSH